jgi:hypothetical protein
MPASTDLDSENDPKDRKVAYLWSKEYEQVCDDLPSNIGRVLFPL